MEENIYLKRGTINIILKNYPKKINMKKITCNIQINKIDESITINGLNEKPLIIDYSKDVDFTSLVSSMVENIDINNKIEIKYELEKSENSSKLELIMNTIETIINKYNEQIEETTKDENTKNSLENILEYSEEQINAEDIPF